MTKQVNITINGYDMQYTCNDNGEWTNDTMECRACESDIRDLLKKHDRKQYASVFPVYSTMGA